MAASGATLAQRVVATPAALDAIRVVRAEHGPLMFFQSGGCCDGSLPLCFKEGELLIGNGDVLLGTLEGSAFYIDGSQDVAWGHPQLMLDTAPGSPEGFSMAAGPGRHFITRSSVCVTPTHRTPLGRPE
ncbi:MAG: DUF779 domain-containing protein [Candidatus Dormibacteria bacterium]